MEEKKLDILGLLKTILKLQVENLSKHISISHWLHTIFLLYYTQTITCLHSNRVHPAYSHTQDILCFIYFSHNE